MRDKDSILLEKLYFNIKENTEQSLIDKIKNLTPLFVVAAQKVLDNWQVDEDGYDDTVADGGVCHLIADEISSICNEHGLDSTTISADIGEQHVWTVVRDEETEEACEVDISPYTYETGGGYHWKKIEGVKIEPSDIHIAHMLYRDAEANWDSMYN
jgi:hypothetical protein